MVISLASILIFCIALWSVVFIAVFLAVILAS
jgi:hypothetical protein